MASTGRLLVVFLGVVALLAYSADANTFAGGVKLQQLQAHRYSEQGVHGEWTELEGMPYQAPLVTQQSIAEAKRMNSGVPVQVFGGGSMPQALNPRMVQQKAHRVTWLADSEAQQTAFADIPPYVFIFTFVGAVGGITVLFYFAERMWAKRQESGQ